MFYGPDQAGIHHRAFGGLASTAAQHLRSLLAERGLDAGVVVDLGCGSGILARTLTDAGYEVTGADISPDMVALARETAPLARFVEGSLFDAELPPGCVAVTAIGEALNYGTDPRAGLDAVARLATRIHDALVPGGLWLFDAAGPGRAGPAQRVVQFHRRDDWCLGMVATESEDRRRLDREITMFIPGDDERYRRVDEHHVLRLYERGELASATVRAGFEVEFIDDYPQATAQATERTPLPGWYVVEATKPGPA
jgi:SAM-dependent methyltransferase